MRLAREGYVQSIRGRGVVVLDHLPAPTEVQLDMRDFSGAQAISTAQKHETVTRVLAFRHMTIDEEVSARTNLPVGEDAYYLERLRILDGHPWIVDINYFLCDVVRGLTLEEAERSIYRFIEQTTGYRIIASRRIFSIRKATRFDRDHLELDGCNCVGIIMNNAFIDTGRLFEFTETRYSPEHFSFTQFFSK
ncbi:GntR family transcriptional regulator [Collinsella tanakaei]|uniref:GntR family transcriptional regulator n=1 Tax=Collinsella tanakaei TaxID=626935 RepID=UPI001956DD59|nr:GntR family transcriptional regulator [Collinsella tanakaei]MBM6868489.1 UTRA domain-containing protein [Collinsella tanakaei]